MHKKYRKKSLKKPKMIEPTKFQNYPVTVSWAPVLIKLEKKVQAHSIHRMRAEKLAQPKLDTLKLIKNI